MTRSVISLLIDIFSGLAFPQHQQPLESASDANPDHSITPSIGFEPGLIVEGTVDYVADGFIKVRVRDTMVFVPGAELPGISRETRKRPTQGSRIELVLQKPSDRKPGEWVGSAARVAEARVRKAIAGLESGDEVDGTVAGVDSEGVTVACNGFEVRVCMNELSWSWIRHPGEAAWEGQAVRLQLVRVDRPAQWLTTPRPRCSPARVFGSIRLMNPAPTVPMVAVFTQGLQLLLTAKARLHPDVDATAQFVLERIADGFAPATIGAVTGLTGRPLEDILQCLMTSGYLQDGLLSNAGKRLADSLILERDLTSSAIPIYFLGAAPPDRQLSLMAVPDSAAAYPAGWPNPPNDAREERRLRQSLRSFIQPYLNHLAGQSETNCRILELTREECLVPRLRLAKGAPVPCAIHVTQSWLLDALWEAFEPVGERPWRAGTPERRPCRAWTMLRIELISDPRTNAVEHFHIEPHTGTAWRVSDPSRVRITSRHRATEGIDAVTRIAGVDLNSWLGEATNIEWCSVRVTQ